MGLNTRVLRNAHEKNHSSKTDFSGILYNFWADRAPKATADYVVNVTPVVLLSHTSEQHKNDFKWLHNLKVSQVSVCGGNSILYILYNLSHLIYCIIVFIV